MRCAATTRRARQGAGNDTLDGGAGADTLHAAATGSTRPGYTSRTNRGERHARRRARRRASGGRTTTCAPTWRTSPAAAGPPTPIVGLSDRECAHGRARGNDHLTGGRGAPTRFDGGAGDDVYRRRRRLRRTRSPAGPETTTVKRRRPGMRFAARLRGAVQPASSAACRRGRKPARRPPGTQSAAVRCLLAGGSIRVGAQPPRPRGRSAAPRRRPSCAGRVGQLRARTGPPRKRLWPRAPFTGLARRGGIHAPSR